MMPSLCQHHYDVDDVVVAFRLSSLPQRQRGEDMEMRTMTDYTPC